MRVWSFLQHSFGLASRVLPKSPKRLCELMQTVPAEGHTWGDSCWATEANRSFWRSHGASKKAGLQPSQRGEGGGQAVLVEATH